MQPLTWTLEEVLPHRGRSILLHEIASWSADALVAVVHVAEDLPYWTAEGIPSFVGLEYMAQACGAWAGCQARSHGEPARIGFLLGSRDYEASVPYFRSGDVLSITARLDFRDGKVGSFNCSIESNGMTYATARITVYQPDPEELT